MKRIVILASLLALAACASFPPGTRVAPGFPDDDFSMSER